MIAKRTKAIFGLLLTAALLCPANASEKLPPDATSPQVDSDNQLMIRFNSLVRRAQIVEKNEGKLATVEFYRDALNDPSFENFGLIHLRLAQLLTQTDNLAAAAFHFVVCHRDRRVDQVDRQVICWQGFKDATAVLTIRELPENARVSVLEPEEFAGPFVSGGRLPKGPLRLLVEVPKRRPHTSRIDLNTDRTWRAELGMSTPEGPLVPDAFINVTKVEKKQSPDGFHVGLLPPSLTTVIGAATLGYGLYLGIETQSGVDEVRKRESQGVCRLTTCPAELDTLAQDANLSDGLLIAGAVITSGGLAWLWYLMSDDSEEE